MINATMIQKQQTERRVAKALKGYVRGPKPSPVACLRTLLFGDPNELLTASRSRALRLLLEA